MGDGEELLAVAFALADAAAQITLPQFRAPSLMVENKADGGNFDPVTQADKAAELAMRAVLAARRPDDGILGEEGENVAGSSGYTWVLDPIDGTRAFLSGVPSWGTLIAVNHGAAPILGMIDQPFTAERFWGDANGAQYQRGRGRPQPIRVRNVECLKDAVLFSTFPEIGTPADRTAFEAVSAAVRLTRYGIDCYAYALLAMGQIDLVIEAGLHPYDIQGPMAVVTGAGGIVTNWDGGPAEAGGRIIAAANRRIYADALELLNSV
ncbi:histidinol-phosphatase [Algicella marina]|uniref:Histidinol-phosphatase n=2 Tax=Algicella marina TaxID=2683284 RepID=A0A6P1T9Q5_9RHOB|nr:histidinol-phosphatase [Algicella marina]